MPRPCTCDNFQRGKPEKKGVHCPLCWKYWQNLSFHRQCGGTGHFQGGTIVEGAPPPRKELPCIHLGEPTGERRQCPSCQGNVEVKLMACAVHTACTMVKKIDGVACCQGCPDKRERP